MKTILTVKVHYILVRDDFWCDEAQLSPARRSKIAEIRSPEARRLSAAADYALNAALTDFVDGYMPPPALSYAPDGRPVVPGAHISLAHTQGLAACAIAAAPVGLDAECADRDLSKIRRKILAPGEGENAPLVDLWVAKEAYLKLTGEGLSGGMTRYAADGETIRDMDGNARANLALFSLPGYKLAICCGEPFQLQTVRVGQG